MPPVERTGGGPGERTEGGPGECTEDGPGERTEDGPGDSSPDGPGDGTGDGPRDGTGGHPGYRTPGDPGGCGRFWPISLRMRGLGPVFGFASRSHSCILGMPVEIGFWPEGRAAGRQPQDASRRTPDARRKTLASLGDEPEDARRRTQDARRQKQGWAWDTTRNRRMGTVPALDGLGTQSRFPGRNRVMSRATLFASDEWRLTICGRRAQGGYVSCRTAVCRGRRAGAPGRGVQP
jgi:hypothetical protein